MHSSHMLSCIHVVGSLHPALGGPSRTVVGLTDALARLSGIEVALATQSFINDPSVVSQDERVKRFVGKTRSSFAIWAGLPVRNFLSSVSVRRQLQIMHSHGVWLPVNFWAGQFARKSNIPLVVQPRGMLEPWSLSNHAWKKRLALLLYQLRDLKAAHVFFATSETEAVNLRKFGLKQPIAIIPNGVDYQSSSLAARPAKPLTRTRYALFLSRIHPVKGLINLVHAWALIKPAGWRLLIAGPDEDFHLQEVLAAARKVGIASSIDYIGSVDGESKSAAFCTADIFVLPTFSENFGLVVAEALAHGLPVITTRGAPWADLPRYGCGWWIDLGVESLSLALAEAMGLTDSARLLMGERGRDYVRRYDWDQIARLTAATYRWVIGRGARPGCVHID